MSRLDTNGSLNDVALSKFLVISARQGTIRDLEDFLVSLFLASLFLHIDRAITCQTRHLFKEVRHLSPPDLYFPDIPGPLRALMADVGPKWHDDTRGHVDMMIAEFSEVLKLTSRDGVTVHRDILYGPRERQHLDVFLPNPLIVETVFPISTLAASDAPVRSRRHHRCRKSRTQLHICYGAFSVRDGRRVGVRLCACSEMRRWPTETRRPSSLSITLKTSRIVLQMGRRIGVRTFFLCKLAR